MMSINEQSYSEAREKQFVEKVAEYDWGSVNCYSTFHNALQEIIDEIFPDVLTVEDSQDIQTANRFNDYYVTIGKCKQEDVKKEAEGEQSAPDPLCLVGDQSPVEPFVSFKPADEGTVKRIISSLKIKPELNPDAYGFTVQLLKSIADIISGTVANLINKSFEEDVFPTELKLAAVLPYEKLPSVDYDHNDPSNFRPVSIVSPLSKVFEDVIVFQLREYFENNHLFSEKQHAHTKGRNMVTAVFSMLKVTVSEIKKKQSVKYTIYDLSEAYDCVDHDILLEKLKRFGLKEKPIKYIESYLKGRSQFVRRCGCRSDTKDVNVGLPQGVKLAPLLFAVYINDLPNFISGSMCTITYADDLSLITPYQENDVRIEEKVKKDVNMWLRSNLLQVEENKIQSLLIPYIKPTKIETVNFLGIILSNDLSWSEHINYLVENKLTSAMTSIQDMVAMQSPFKVLREAYIDKFYLSIGQHILLWGHAEEANIIFEKQKEVISMLRQGDDSIKSTFKYCKLLTVPSLYIRSCLRFAHGLSNSDTVNLEIYRTGPKYTVSDLYNAIPETIKKFDQAKFHYSITKILTESAFFSIEEFLKLPKNSKLYYRFSR